MILIFNFINLSSNIYALIELDKNHMYCSPKIGQKKAEKIIVKKRLS